MTHDTRTRNLATTVTAAGLTLLVVLIGWLIVAWTINRVYVEPGQSLMLIYKGPFVFGDPPSAQPGHFAAVDKQGDPIEKGVLEQMKGPGRHFYCPLWWKREIVDDLLVEPGKVAIVSSKLGSNLEGGKFLVDGDLGSTQYKGVLRKAFTAGRYRVNPYAYQFTVVGTQRNEDGNQVKHAGWVNIPTGAVGVVTNLADNPLAEATAGIQNKVLPPGLYPVNPKEQQIDIVEIGFREVSLAVNKSKDGAGLPVLDQSGEPQLAAVPGGISFPSNDGFKIYIDFTAVWGLMPDQAPDAVRKFGNVDAVENKVVVPQIESICRNMGSRFAAVDLLVGDSRQQFQLDTSTAFETALQEKNVTVQRGLVRYIYIPNDVRTPIQMGYIADELKLTRDQEQLTAKTEASLREAERRVELEAERVIVETEKFVAKQLAEGNKTAQQTVAETTKLVAAVDKQVAELEAQATVLLGRATAKADQLSQEAKAQKFKLAVQAFGSGSAYNQWVFASGLPDDVRLNLLYAGEGTFWTDLKGLSETLLGRQVQQEQRK